jgi:hypothetical protein
MTGEAAAALGAPELAGSLVNPKGMTKRVTASVAGGVAGGLVGGMAARAAVGDVYAGGSDVPAFGRVGYLAVTEGEIALIKTKTGLMKMKVTDEVLARVPRSEIASVGWDGGMMLSHLTITFTDGGVWEFDVPKASKKTAEGVVKALG